VGLGAAVAGEEGRRRVGAPARIEGGSVGRRRGAGEGMSGGGRGGGTVWPARGWGRPAGGWGRT
jgi:hypothetical protein